jgi:hypothetical protein
MAGIIYFFAPGRLGMKGLLAAFLTSVGPEEVMDITTSSPSFNPVLASALIPSLIPVSTDTDSRADPFFTQMVLTADTGFPDCGT